MLIWNCYINGVSEWWWSLLDGTYSVWLTTITEHFSCFGCVVYACAICCSLQWRIQDFAEGGANPRGEALWILNASNSVCVWVWGWTAEWQWKSLSNGQMVIRRQNSCQKITIQPFDRLFQIWQMVIRQLFCRRIAWGISKTWSTNLLLLLFTKNCVNMKNMDCVVFLSLYLNVILVLLHEKFKNISHSLVHASKKSYFPSVADPNSFIFMQFPAKLLQNNRLAWGVDAPSEILDLPKHHN